MAANDCARPAENGTGATNNSLNHPDAPVVLVAAPDPTPPLKRRRLTVTWAANVKPERVEFLDDGRIPKGKITVLAGDPGLGKSQYTCMLAARVSRSAPVLMLNAEDGESDTMRPRLAAAGADLGRVGFAKMRDEYGEDGLVLPDDADELRELVVQTGVQLVVIDPVMAHLGGRINGAKDQDIRRALAPLARLADELGVTFVMVAHLKKAEEANTLYRVGGSIGLTGAARSVLFLGRDPDDPDGENGDQRVLLHVKCNVGPMQATQVYRIESAADGDAETSRLVYVGESERSVQEVFGTDDEPTKSDRAADFLREALADGQRPTKDVEEQAQREGITKRTLERARKRAGVKSDKGDDGRWWLSLKSTPPVPVAAVAALDASAAALADLLHTAATRTGGWLTAAGFAPILAESVERVQEQLEAAVQAGTVRLRGDGTTSPREYARAIPNAAGLGVSA